MFKKLIEIFTGGGTPIEPHKGKRLERELAPSGEPKFTIKGTGYPGFFILFGSGFLIIATIILSGVLLGTSGEDSSEFTLLFAILFLIPFFLIGGATLSLGIFLFLGRTQVIFGAQSVSMERSLFGRVFQRKQLKREGIDIQLEKSHEENNRARYKLSLNSDGKKLSLGGSLKDEELLWLEREFQSTLGKTITESPVCIASLIHHQEEKTLEEAEIDPDYHSKNLHFSKTIHGWKALYKHGLSSSVFCLIFGSIFLLSGLAMEGSLIVFLREKFPAFDELVKSVTSSGGPPPVWFWAVFSLIGSVIILLGIWLLGYRMTLSKRHSRIHLAKRWFIIGTERVFETSTIQELKAIHSGSSNGQSRFKLELTQTSGKKIALVRWASGDDAGQIQAWLQNEKAS